jgi:DNA-binding NarL/FixJ family response regulator
MSDQRLRVVVADDHYLVREGVKQVLELDGTVCVVATAANVPELVAAVDATAPDCVITDIRMPPTHTVEGLDAVRQLRATRPALGVIVLSNHADPSYAFELFRDGMTGLAYLLKDRVGDREQLLRALAAVADGGSVVDPAVVDGLIQRRARRADTSPVSRLTDRERDVLEAMAGGMSNSAIAQCLHLSRSAIEKHISAIFTKLDIPDEPSVHRRVEAVLAFLARPADDH